MVVGVASLKVRVPPVGAIGLGKRWGMLGLTSGVRTLSIACVGFWRVLPRNRNSQSASVCGQQLTQLDGCLVPSGNEVSFELIRRQTSQLFKHLLEDAGLWGPVEA